MPAPICENCKWVRNEVCVNDKAEECCDFVPENHTCDFHEYKEGLND